MARGENHWRPISHSPVLEKETGQKVGENRTSPNKLEPVRGKKQVDLQGAAGIISEKEEKGERMITAHWPG